MRADVLSEHLRMSADDYERAGDGNRTRVLSLGIPSPGYGRTPTNLKLQVIGSSEQWRTSANDCVRAMDAR
jgi:hypothetical protein